MIILVLLQMGLGLIYLKTVPRFYNDDAWEASLGYSLAFEGSLRHGIIEGWGGMHVHFLQNQVVQPFALAVAYRLAGLSIITSRLPSLLFSVLAVISVYGVMRRWLGARRGWVVGLATILHPWFFEASRRVRPDIYAVALAFVGLWCFVRACDAGRRTGMLTAGVFIGLAGLAHPTGFVLGAAMIGGVLVWQRPKPLARLLAWGVVGFLAALLPYAIYVVWASQHPQVDFFQQMRGSKPVVATDLAAIFTGELDRWSHFLQWPKGAPLAVIMWGAWGAAWYRSTRADKTIATIILLFAMAMPFTTVNTTSRYLVGLIPLFSALIVRLVERILTGGPTRTNVAHKCRLLAGVGTAAVYVLMCVAAIGVMCHRLRGADLTRVLDRIAAVTGPDARVYGDLIFWMGRDQYRFGPYPEPDPWRASVPIDAVRRHRFDYAIRAAWGFTSSHGVSTPPAAMPEWKSENIVDQVCKRYGTRVAAFRDPHFGPIEIYRLNWD